MRWRLSGYSKVVFEYSATRNPIAKTNRDLNLSKLFQFEINPGKTIPNNNKDDLLMISRRTIERKTWIFAVNANIYTYSWLI